MVLLLFYLQRFNKDIEEILKILQLVIIALSFLCMS